MKLHAFRDRKDDPNKDMAQHHALDLYRIAAMLTLDEYNIVQGLAKQYRETPSVQDARRIVGDFFSNLENLGVLRMREHPLFSKDMNLMEFIDVLRGLLPPM